MNKMLIAASLLGALAAPSTPAAQPSAYAGQEQRQIKALAPEEIDGYLAGKGSGLAKAAELNGYPGPSHVLELASALELTPAQRARTQALFESMQARAAAVGKALVDEEAKLDDLFATRAITPSTLQSALQTIGRLQADVRQAHLDAHLTQAIILTPEQSRRYWTLRGYGSADAAGQDERHHAH